MATTSRKRKNRPPATSARSKAKPSDNVQFDLPEFGPDLDVIARQVVDSKKRSNSPAPPVVDLAAAITDVTVRDTIQGSSTLEINLIDEEWNLMDSGFFDHDENGRLDPIELNYPDGSRYWWRISSIDPSSDHSVTITFLERPAALLTHYQGPIKANRAKKTRSEFLQLLARKVRPEITFISGDLHEEQPSKDKPLPKDKPTKFVPKKVPKAEREKTKSPGIAKGSHITIQGAPASRQKLEWIERAMDVAAKTTKGQPAHVAGLATRALLVAGIGESNFEVNVCDYKYHTHCGIWQSNQIPASQVETQAYHFMKGGRSFRAGGAIGAVKANPSWTAGHIALYVEVSDASGAQFYDRWHDEAVKIIDAYGGPGSLGGGFTAGGGTIVGGTHYKRKAYFFHVGSHEEPHETYWDAMNRLAEEVKWALFLDGDRLYFDPETTLIRQKPALVVSRSDPFVVSWDYTWDVRHIATEMSLTLICDPLEFRAGQVFWLHGFGAASTGSTAKLPGRWLIAESERSHSSLATTFTLKQPESALKEPAAEVIKITDPSTTVSGASTADLRKLAKNGKVGTVHKMPGADRAGVPTHPPVYAFLKLASGVLGKPIYISTGSNHQQHAASCNTSDHWTGWAADLGSAANHFAIGGIGGNKIAAACAAVCGLRYKDVVGTWEGHSWNYDGQNYRVQIGWKVPDHYDHVHVGLSPR